MLSHMEWRLRAGTDYSLENDWLGQYGENAANTKYRWEVYKHSVNGRDTHREVIEALSLKGHETIVDVGCGDGVVLADLRVKSSHEGRLINTDVNGSQFWPVVTYLGQSGVKPVEWVVANAADFDMPDNSVDVVLSLFMMYHIPPELQRQTLENFKRILAPGGRLALATSGRFNKFRHRIFEDEMARYASLNPPIRMNKSFDTDMAEAVLPDYFAVEHHKVHDELEFSSKTSPVYLSSLRSMFNLFEPAPSPQLNLALKEVVQPQIEQEIAQRGSFQDLMAQDFFICTKLA